MTERIALDLPDGRTLDVQVSGPPAGALLVWHHGTPGCSHQLRNQQRALGDRGIRLATYARAGAAGSTRHPGRTVADVAADVAAIADHLGADRFLTGGQSGGGPHALATGALLPDRVLAVLAVCSIKPYAGQPDFLDGMGADNIEEFSLALEGEAALEPYLLAEGEAMRAAGAQGIIEAISSLLPEVDREVLAAPEGEDIVRNIQGGAEQVHGWLDDDLAFTRDWGFALEDIRVPAYVWQGSADLMVPFHHGQWLAAHVPGAVAHLEQGEGHLSIEVRHFERMVDEVAAHLPR
jgi:pimeloyl-ACP methyl ester carboxylesterase